MTEVSAKLSRFKSSASKIRLLADQIRGKKVDEALDILTFSPKSGSRNLKKLLDSAISSAENNYGLDINNSNSLKDLILIKLSLIHISEPTRR